MKTLDSTTLALIASGQLAVVQMMRLDFVSGTIAWNSSNYQFTWDGVVYVGAAGLGAVQPISDAPGEVKGLQFTFSGVSANNVSLALDGSDQWQGTPATILTALVDTATFIVRDAEVEWSGLGDTMTMTEDGDQSTVSATAESSAVDLLRGIPLTYTDADQQTLHPGDTAFQYVNQQADHPVIWPDKQFFQK